MSINCLFCGALNPVATAHVRKYCSDLCRERAQRHGNRDPEKMWAAAMAGKTYARGGGNIVDT